MKKINKIALFYNNLRGYYLFQRLIIEGYQITNILAKKNLNPEVLNKCKADKIIKNLKSLDFLKFIKKKILIFSFLQVFFIFPKN